MKPSIAITHPHLLLEVSPDNDIDLESVTHGSTKKPLWKCQKSKCQYEWRAECHSRSRGSGCPACVGQAVTKKNCLATTHPHLLKEISPNNNLSPHTITAGTKKQILWKCLVCQHEWQASCDNRCRGSGCPSCTNQTTTKDNCLATKNPTLAKEWHPIKNEHLSPSKIVPGSGKKVWWQCSKCNHEWMAPCTDRNSGIGCPACSGLVATTKNCLATNRPDLAKEWHHTKNKLSPYQILPSSNKKVWWECNKCNYEWKATCANRKNGSGCPACSGRVATKINCLATQHPLLCEDWSDKNNFHPTEVAPGSKKKVWWKCNKCCYEWETPICWRSNGNGCPLCAGRVVTKDNCTAALHPHLLQEFISSNNGLDLYSITPGSNEKCLWVCQNCSHKWETVCRARTRKNGTGCPRCCSNTSKPEVWLYEHLKSLGVNVIHNKRLPKKLTKREIRPDIRIEETKKIIEYNGDYFHCNPKKFSPDYFNKKIKMTAASKWAYDAQRLEFFQSLGYEILVVWESDWKEDKEKVLSEILRFIES